MTREEFIIACMEDGDTEEHATWLADMDDEWYPSVHDIIRRAEEALKEEEELYEAV